MLMLTPTQDGALIGMSCIRWGLTQRPQPDNAQKLKDLGAINPIWVVFSNPQSSPTYTVEGSGMTSQKDQKNKRCLPDTKE